MKLLLRFLFVVAIITMFISCTRNDATNVSFSSEETSLKVGQSDTIIETVNYTGDQTRIQVTASTSDDSIISVSVSKEKEENELNDSEFNDSIFIKALTPGTTSIVVYTGSHKHNISVNVTQTSFTMQKAQVVNLGFADPSKENYIYDMCFLPNTLTVDTATQKISGTGQYIHIEAFYLPSTDSLPSGTCLSNDGCLKNTFMPGEYCREDGEFCLEGTYIATVTNDTIEYTLIKSGKYTVSVSGTDYNIKGDLETETNEIIHFNYTGKVNTIDKKEKPEVIKPQFTIGEALYAGDYYNLGLSHTYFLYLETKDVNVRSYTVNGQYILLQINADESFTDYIPVGTYKVMTATQYKNLEVSPLSIVPGNYHLFEGNDVPDGSWYVDGTTYSKKRLVSGEVNIVPYAKYYNINYSLYDRSGSLITGTFNAPVTFKMYYNSNPYGS